MARTWTEPMGWEAEGSAPSVTLAKEGFKAGYKPPANIFNYFLHRLYLCTTELQSAVDEHDTKLSGVPTNLRDGRATGSVRGIGTTEESPEDMAGSNPDESYFLGNYAAAFGTNTKAPGQGAFAAGTNNEANDSQAVFGSYASITSGLDSTDWTGSVFVVGIGNPATRQNGFRVSMDGRCYGMNSFASAGADYAEYFEWLDGNPDNEDRRGRFVTLDGDKIRFADANDDYILGAVSSAPSIVGNAFSENWHKKYLCDVFGNRITEEVFVEETTDENGDVIPAHYETRYAINPEYDENLEYVSRDKRKEWSAIGTHGQLVVVDDGTCEVNGYCRVSDGGIGTAASERTDYRVIKRLDDNHVKIYIK